MEKVSLPFGNVKIPDRVHADAPVPSGDVRNVGPQRCDTAKTAGGRDAFSASDLSSSLTVKGKKK